MWLAKCPGRHSSASIHSFLTRGPDMPPYTPSFSPQFPHTHLDLSKATNEALLLPAARWP